MFIKRTVRFFEPYLPPRCRKVRCREVREIFSVEIKEVGSTEAPVAIIEHGRIFHPRIEYHWHQKRLFTRVRLSYFLSLNGKRDRQAKPTDISVPFDDYAGEATQSKCKLGWTCGHRSSSSSTASYPWKPASHGTASTRWGWAVITAARF